MLTEFTMEQFVDEVARLRGVIPARDDCSMELSTGSDIRQYLVSLIRNRYARLLMEADPQLLPVGEFATRATVTENAGDGSATVILPSECVRPLSIRLAEWATEAIVESYSHTLRSRQCNRYLRSGRTRPRAMTAPDGRSLRLWPGASGEVVSLRGVRQPEENVIILDRSLISQFQDL